MLIQNEQLDKLTNITQNLENKPNQLQKKMVEYENKLNQLEEKKNNYAMRWFRKQICWSSNLTARTIHKKRKYSNLWRRKQRRQR